jgi:hypothetical protein
MTKKISAAVSHYQLEIEELRADRELAAAYLKLALQSLDDPRDRAAGLLAVRSVAQAYRCLVLIADSGA